MASGSTRPRSTSIATEQGSASAARLTHAIATTSRGTPGSRDPKIERCRIPTNSPPTGPRSKSASCCRSRKREATQYEIPLLNVNSEPYFAGELCDSRWVKLTPITADTEVGRHLSDTGWLCESTTSARFCHTLDGELGWEQGFFSCSSSERSNAYWLQEWKRSQ